jgi:hypothetical protein
MAINIPFKNTSTETFTNDHNELVNLLDDIHVSCDVVDSMDGRVNLNVPGCFFATREQLEKFFELIRDYDLDESREALESIIPIETFDDESIVTELNNSILEPINQLRELFERQIANLQTVQNLNKNHKESITSYEEEMKIIRDETIRVAIKILEFVEENEFCDIYNNLIFRLAEMHPNKSFINRKLMSTTKNSGYEKLSNFFTRYISSDFVEDKTRQEYLLDYYEVGSFREQKDFTFAILNAGYEIFECIDLQHTDRKKTYKVCFIHDYQSPNEKEKSPTVFSLELKLATNNPSNFIQANLSLYVGINSIAKRELSFWTDPETSEIDFQSSTNNEWENEGIGTGLMYLSNKCIETVMGAFSFYFTEGARAKITDMAIGNGTSTTSKECWSGAIAMELGYNRAYNKSTIYYKDYLPPMILGI